MGPLDVELVWEASTPSVGEGMVENWKAKRRRRWGRVLLVVMVAVVVVVMVAGEVLVWWVAMGEFVVSEGRPGDSLGEGRKEELDGA